MNILIFIVWITLIAATLMLPYFIQAFTLVLKERKKETFRIEYVTGYDHDVQDYLKTRNRTIYAKLKYKDEKSLLEQATKIVKDRHPYFMNVRDIKTFSIQVIGDKVHDFKFKI